MGVFQCCYITLACWLATMAMAIEKWTKSIQASAKAPLRRSKSNLSSGLALGLHEEALSSASSCHQEGQGREEQLQHPAGRTFPEPPWSTSPCPRPNAEVHLPWCRRALDTPGVFESKSKFHPSVHAIWYLFDPIAIAVAAICSKRRKNKPVFLKRFGNIDIDIDIESIE